MEIDPTASSRLIGSYMVYYAIGTGGGAIAATIAYSAWGWAAVCILGAGLSTVALLIWAADRFSSTDSNIAPIPAALRTEALEQLLTERGLIDPAVMDTLITEYEVSIGPLNGAKVVAKAAHRPATTEERS